MNKLVHLVDNLLVNCQEFIKKRRKPEPEKKTGPRYSDLLKPVGDNFPIPHPRTLRQFTETRTIAPSAGFIHMDEFENVQDISERFSGWMAENETEWFRCSGCGGTFYQGDVKLHNEMKYCPACWPGRKIHARKRAF